MSKVVARVGRGGGEEGGGRQRKEEDDQAGASGSQMMVNEGGRGKGRQAEEGRKRLKSVRSRAKQSDRLADLQPSDLQAADLDANDTQVGRVVLTPCQLGLCGHAPSGTGERRRHPPGATASARLGPKKYPKHMYTWHVYHDIRSDLSSTFRFYSALLPFCLFSASSRDAKQNQSGPLLNRIQVAACAADGPVTPPFLLSA